MQRCTGSWSLSGDQLHLNKNAFLICRAFGCMISTDMKDLYQSIKKRCFCSCQARRFHHVKHSSHIAEYEHSWADSGAASPWQKKQRHFHFHYNLNHLYICIYTTCITIRELVSVSRLRWVCTLIAGFWLVCIFSSHWNSFSYCILFIVVPKYKGYHWQQFCLWTLNNATFHKNPILYTPTLIVTPCFSTQSKWRQLY